MTTDAANLPHSERETLMRESQAWQEAARRYMDAPATLWSWWTRMNPQLYIRMRMRADALFPERLTIIPGEQDDIRSLAALFLAHEAEDEGQ